MKKTVFLFLFTIALLSIEAQPILNKLYDFNVGHVYGYRKVPANWNIDTTLIPTIGNNLTWNFDTLTLSSTVYNDSILSPANKPGTSSFPGASYVWKEYSGVFQYYTKVVDTVFYMGNYSFYPATFSPNPKTAILTTTISSGYIYNNFQTNVAGNGTWTYSARYNAFGTLKLPGITHNNVGLYVTVGGKANLKFADYMWFKENQADPVMRIQFVWNTNGSTVQYLYVNTTALTSIQELDLSSISISPNPANEFLNVKREILNKPATINITNALGQMVWSLSGVEMQTTEINIKNLNSGVYFVTLTQQGKSSTVKFIKE